MDIFLFLAYKDTKMFLMISLVVVFSICLHEFFHAWTALQFGDTTAADRGHLTLNPLRQMGPMSIIMFLLLGFAWGAVPVNPAFLRARNRHAPAIVFGYFTACSPKPQIRRLLRDFAAATGKPVFQGLPFGHEHPKCSYLCGAPVEIRPVTSSQANRP